MVVEQAQGHAIESSYCRSPINLALGSIALNLEIVVQQPHFPHSFRFLAMKKVSLSISPSLTLKNPQPWSRVFRAKLSKLSPHIAPKAALRPECKHSMAQESTGMAPAE